MTMPTRTFDLRDTERPLGRRTVLRLVAGGMLLAASAVALPAAVAEKGLPKKKARRRRRRQRRLCKGMDGLRGSAVGAADNECDEEEDES